MTKGMLPLKLINTKLGPKEIEFRQRQAIDNSLFTKGACRYPKGNLFSCAAACVEIVLLHSDEAGVIFNDMVKALDLPGCQLIFTEARNITQTFRKWDIESISRGKILGLAEQWCDWQELLLPLKISIY